MATWACTPESMAEIRCASGCSTLVTIPGMSAIASRISPSTSSRPRSLRSDGHLGLHPREHGGNQVRKRLLHTGDNPGNVGHRLANLAEHLVPPALAPI